MLVGLLVAWAGLAGCDSGGAIEEEVPPPEDPGVVDPREDTSTWETIQRRILQPNCAAACHHSGTSFAQQSGLVLTEDVAYEQLAEVAPKNAAARDDGLVRLSTAGATDLHRSFLWEKINMPNEEHFFVAHPHYGSLMPLGGDPLTYGELTYIRDWIQAGAPKEGEVADRAALADTTRYDRNNFKPLLPPPNGIPRRLGPFDVAPNFERELFYYELLDEGEDLFIDYIEVTMRPGSHHFLLYTFDPSTPANIIPPSGLFRDIRTVNGSVIQANLQPMLYHVFWAGTQWPRMNYRFPPGVALRLPAGTGLDLNSHYVNRTDDMKQGEVHVNLHRVDESAVRHVAEVLVMNNLTISLPPNRVTTLRRDFPILQRMHVFQLFSHAHEHMTEFKVEIVGGARNGEVIYVATDWEHPPILELDPPLTLEPGQALRLITTYNNWTNRTLSFGLLSEDEMMILFGYFYTDS